MNDFLDLKFKIFLDMFNLNELYIIFTFGYNICEILTFGI